MSFRKSKSLKLSLKGIVNIFYTKLEFSPSSSVGIVIVIYLFRHRKSTIIRFLWYINVCGLSGDTFLSSRIVLSWINYVTDLINLNLEKAQWQQRILVVFPFFINCFQIQIFENRYKFNYDKNDEKFSLLWAMIAMLREKKLYWCNLRALFR